MTCQDLSQYLRLQVYLHQGPGSGPSAADDRAELDSERWTEIAKLLSRKHDRIDPLHALSLLPDGVRRAVAMQLQHRSTISGNGSSWPAVNATAVMQVPLSAVLPFLEGALRAAGERRRNASVIKSLRKAENLQCREAAIRCRQR